VSIPANAIIYAHAFSAQDGNQTYSENTLDDPATGWCVYAVTELPEGERPCHFEEDYTSHQYAMEAAEELAKPDGLEIREY